MSAAIAWVASDGVAVGREGSCERMLSGLYGSVISMRYECIASILEIPTSQFELAQEFDGPIVAAPVAGSRPRAQKRSVYSVGRTCCVVVFDSDTLQRARCHLVVLAEVLRRMSEQSRSRDSNFAVVSKFKLLKFTHWIRR